MVVVQPREGRVVCHSAAGCIEDTASHLPPTHLIIVNHAGASFHAAAGCIEDTAEEVTRRGGHGVAVVCDHTDAGQAGRGAAWHGNGMLKGPSVQGRRQEQTCSHQPPAFCGCCIADLTLALASTC